MTSLKALTVCWLALMALTAIMLLTGDPQGSTPLPLWSIAVLLFIALLKGRQILWVFLGLDQSTPLWKATLLTMIGSVLSIVMGFAGLAHALGGL